MVENEITLEEIITPVRGQLESLDEIMVNTAIGHHPDLISAVHHIISAGGKRIRPLVCLHVGQMYEIDQRLLAVLAASIEMLHTATLVHDDLIDGSLLRRGEPTLNAKWSPAATVLTGDFLFAKAAELAASTLSPPVLEKFAKTLSIIVNGEINQIFMSRGLLSRDDYYGRIYAKTASLLELSASAPALMIGKTEHYDALVEFGIKIGMAFQMVDDILDFISDETELGKPVASDLKQGLFTLPTIYYFEDNESHPLVQKILAGTASEEEMYKVFHFIKGSTAVSKAIEEARQQVYDAMDILDSLGLGEKVNDLRKLSQYIIGRNL